MILSSGKYCPDGLSQFDCQNGTLCEAGSISPIRCPLGYYCKDKFNKIACITGSYCPEGSAEMTPCPASYFCITPSVRTKCTPGMLVAVYICAWRIFTYH
jgi:hypothetical protein